MEPVASPEPRRPEPGAALGGTQSVDRAVSILETLASVENAAVGEIARQLGVHKSTASRLLAALERGDLVEKAGDRGRYRLGFGLVRLAGAVTGRLDIISQGHEVCERLADNVQETVNIAVRQGTHAVNLSESRGPAAVAAHSWVGQPTPLHATSSGKVMLAGLERRRRRALLGVGLARFTPATVTSWAVLDRELDQVVTDGFAITLEEFEAGLNAVAAPVRSRDGAVLAAVSASGPAYRFTADRLRESAPALVSGADEIGRRLGA